MKHCTGIHIALLLLLLSSLSCSKKTPPVLLGEAWPQSWVLVFDDGNSQFFKLLESSGTVVLRTDIGKAGFDRNYLAGSSSKNCEWTAKLTDPANSIVSLELKRDPNKAWAVASEVHPLNNEVFWYLRVRTISTTPGSKDWQFYYRNKGSENGVKKITLESVHQPGYFVANAATVSFGNGIRLIPATGNESNIILLQY